jgi:hypothetical protein
MTNFTIKPKDVDFVLPNFTAGELEIVNSLEFTRNIILELLDKSELDSIDFDHLVSQLNIAIANYIQQLRKYADVAPKLIAAQFLVEEVIYKLQQKISKPSIVSDLNKLGRLKSILQSLLDID